MELAEQIDGAPKNGYFIILRNAGSWELGRWAPEAHGWVRPDGTPVRISPTHWTPLSDDLPGGDRERSLFIARPLPVPNHEAEQTERRPITGLIVALVTAICCVGGIVFWIGSQDPRSDLALVDVEREFSRERNRAYVVIGGLTSAREREAVALTNALEGPQSSKPSEPQQVRAQSETRSEAFPRKLAEAGEKEVAGDNLAPARERENAAPTPEAKQVTDARPKELKQALEKNKIRLKRLTDELASARANEVAARNLAAARERQNAAKALETQQIADARQKEMKHALDESESKVRTLAEELASARANEVVALNLAAAREREIAARALEAKQNADARQKELKQVLDDTEVRLKALTDELASARANEVAAGNLAAARERENAAPAVTAEQIATTEQTALKQPPPDTGETPRPVKPEHSLTRGTIVSAGKVSDAELPAGEAPAPTGPLAAPMEELNGGFEITSSIVTAQQRNEVAARQASSDATPARVGALERTGPLTPPDSHQVQTRTATSSAEEDKLIARANSLIKQFDFVGARLLLAYALEKGSARAAFIIAETYDWQILRSMHASGARGDDQIARKFYQLAAAAGIEKAQERLEALQPDANAALR